MHDDPPSRRGATELIIKPCPQAARTCCTFRPTSFSSVQFMPSVPRLVPPIMSLTDMCRHVVARRRPLAAHDAKSFPSVRTQLLTATHFWCTFTHLCHAFTDLCHAMGVLPSTRPVAALGFSFFFLTWLARMPCHARCAPYAEATVFGVGMNVGCDDCNDDGRTSPGSAIAMERGEASSACACGKLVKDHAMHACIW